MIQLLTTASIKVLMNYVRIACPSPYTSYSYLNVNFWANTIRQPS